MKVVALVFALVVLLFILNLNSPLSSLIVLEAGTLVGFILLCMKSLESLLSVSSALTFLIVSICLASLGLSLLVVYSRSCSNLNSFSSLVMP